MSQNKENNSVNKCKKISDVDANILQNSGKEKTEKRKKVRTWIFWLSEFKSYKAAEKWILHVWPCLSSVLYQTLCVPTRTKAITKAPSRRDVSYATVCLCNTRFTAVTFLLLSLLFCDSTSFICTCEWRLHAFPWWRLLWCLRVESYSRVSKYNHAFHSFAQLYVSLVVVYQKKLSSVLVRNVQRLQRNDR